MRKRRFLHRESILLHAKNPEFSGNFLGFEGRVVFNNDVAAQCSEDLVEIERGDGYNSLNIYTREQCVLDQKNLQQAVNLGSLKNKIPVINSPRTYSTNVDTRGSFSLMSDDLSRDIQYSDVNNSSIEGHNAFDRKAHFGKLLIEDIPENSAQNLDAVKLQLSTENSGILKADHDSQSLGNTNILEWLKNNSGEKNAEKTLEGGRKLRDEKIKILDKDSDNHIQQISKITLASPASTEFATLKTNYLSTLVAVSGFQNFTPAGLKNLYKEVTYILENTTQNLKTGEEAYLKRVKNIVENSLLVQSLSVEKTILDPDNGPWQKKILDLENVIKTKKEELEKAPYNDPQKKSDKIVLIGLEQDLKEYKTILTLRKSYQSEYNEIHTGEKAYSQFFLAKNEEEQGSKARLHSTTSAIKDLGEYYNWAEKTVFSQGISKPINKEVRSFLLAHVFRGNISAKKLNEGLLKIVSSTSTTMSYQRNVTTAQYKISEFYDAIASKNLAKLQKFSGVFDRTTFQQIQTAFSVPEKAGDKAPLAEKKHGESVERAFERQHGVSPRQILVKWEQNKANPLSNNEGHENGPHTKTIGDTFPPENWFDTAGNIATKSSENFILFKNAIKSAIPVGLVHDKKSPALQKIFSGEWEKNDAEVIPFLKSLQGYIVQENSLEKQHSGLNTLKGQNDFMKKVKQSFDGGIVPDFISNAWEEVKEGNLSYTALFAIAGFVFLKNPKVRNFMLGVGGVAALNEVIRDTTGVDYLQQGIDMIAGKSESQKGNVASWVALSMNKNKELEHDDIEFDEFERAGTILGGNSLPDVLAWRKSVEMNKSQGKKEVFTGNMPKGLCDNISQIRYGANVSEEQQAEIAYVFLEKYFLHIDTKRGNSLPPTSENGFKYIADTYKKDEKGEPYTLASVFLMETTQAEREYVFLDKSPIITLFGEWTEETYEFLEHKQREWGLTMPEIITKFQNIKKEANALGLKMKINLQNELEFWDKSKKAVGSIKKIGEEWVLQPITGLVSLGVAGKGYETFEKAWEGMKKGVSDSLTVLNGIFQGITVDMLKEPCTLSNGTDVYDIFLSWGVDDEISEIYGFSRPSDFKAFLQYHWGKNTDVNSLASIFEKFAKEGGSGAITKKDLLQFFMAPMYATGEVSNFIVNGVQAGLGISSNISQGMVSVLNNQPGTKVANVFEMMTPRQNQNFHKFTTERNPVVEKMKNMKTASKPGIQTTNGSSSLASDLRSLEVQIWTNERALEVNKYLKNRIQRWLIKENGNNAFVIKALNDVFHKNLNSNEEISDSLRKAENEEKIHTTNKVEHGPTQSGLAGIVFNKSMLALRDYLDNNFGFTGSSGNTAPPILKFPNSKDIIK